MCVCVFVCVCVSVSVIVSVSVCVCVFPRFLPPLAIRCSERDTYVSCAIWEIHFIIVFSLKTHICYKCVFMHLHIYTCIYMYM